MDGEQVPTPAPACQDDSAARSSVVSQGTPASTAAASRFAFVDALRGIAALCIVLFHIWWYEPRPRAALETAHWTIEEAMRRTRGGVQILLVISGFVIAYTMRRTWFNLPEARSFLARRVVRLVPAYWVALGFVVLIDAICRQYLDLPPPNDGRLTVLRAVTHMTFLQDVFRQEALGAGYWTLCIEMQFYIVSILGWGLAQRLFPRPVKDEPRPSMWGLLCVFAPPAFMSLFYWRAMDSTDQWVIRFLWMFFLGMSTWWALDRSIPISAYAMIVLVGALHLYYVSTWRYQNSVALTTALAIFVAGYFDRLHVWLNWGPLQHLGRISYSVYLIHFPVCHLLTHAGWKWFGDEPTPAQAEMILLAALPLSLLAGQLLYVLVETPSARWSAKMKK